MSSDKEKIKAEIERRKKEVYGIEWGWAVQCATYDEIISFIDSLQEEPVSEDFDNIYHEWLEKEWFTGIHPMSEFMRMTAEHFYELGKNTKEFVSEDLEEAAEEYAYTNWQSDDYHEGAAEGLPFDAIGHTEKCFKAGAKWDKERIIKKACKWLKENATYVHPRKDVETCMVNLTAFKEAMEE